MTVVVSLRIGRRTQTQVALLDVLLPHDQTWRHRRWFVIRAWRPMRQVRKRAFDQRLQTVMVEMAGRGHDEIRGQIGARKVPAEAGGVERAHSVRGSENRPPKRMPRPELLSKHFVNQVVRRI